MKCDGTRAETRFRLSAKRTSPFKSAGASVQSTTGSRGVRISGSNAGYTMFRGSVNGTGYPLHSPISPSLPLPCVTVCHHFSIGVCLSLSCSNLRWDTDHADRAVLSFCSVSSSTCWDGNVKHGTAVSFKVLFNSLSCSDSTPFSSNFYSFVK